MLICKKCFVSGRVQGVFYRASSQSQAGKLAITGYAINLANGGVEVLACGKKENVEQFCDWLWIGSSSSKVDSVQCENVNETPAADFSIS